MSLKNTDTQYGKVAIFLHWLMAIMIITLVIVGFYMTGLEDSDDKWKVYGLHKASGLLVFVLALIRWYWMLTNDKPKPLDNWTKFDTAVSHATKWLLMILLFIMPLAGIIMSLAGGHAINFFGIFVIDGFAQKNEQLASIAHEMHEIGAVVIAVIVALHVLGGLKHHFIAKDNTLNRMLGRDK